MANAHPYQSPKDDPKALLDDRGGLNREGFEREQYAKSPNRYSFKASGPGEYHISQNLDVEPDLDASKPARRENSLAVQVQNVRPAENFPKYDIEFTGSPRMLESVRDTLEDASIKVTPRETNGETTSLVVSGKSINSITMELSSRRGPDKHIILTEAMEAKLNTAVSADVPNILKAAQAPKTPAAPAAPKPHPYTLPREPRHLLDESGKPNWEAFEREQYATNPNRYHLLTSESAPGNYTIGQNMRMEPDASEDAAVQRRRDNMLSIELVNIVPGTGSNPFPKYDIQFTARPPMLESVLLALKNGGVKAEPVKVDGVLTSVTATGKGIETVLNELAGRRAPDKNLILSDAMAEKVGVAANADLMKLQQKGSMTDRVPSKPLGGMAIAGSSKPAT